MVVYSFFFRKHIHIQTTHCGRFAIWTTFGFLTGVVVPRCTRWSRVAIWTIFTFTFTFTFTGGAKVHPLVEGRNLDNFHFHFHFHFHWWCQGAPVGRGSQFGQFWLSLSLSLSLVVPRCTRWSGVAPNPIVIDAPCHPCPSCVIFLPVSFSLRHY